MTEEMQVFKDVEEIELDGGHKLKIHLANFIEGERLFTSVAKCYSQGIEGISLLDNERVKLALLPCIQKSFFDNVNIKDLSFFEDVNKRPFYVPICMNVIEVNIKPFMTSPLS